MVRRPRKNRTKAQRFAEKLQMQWQSHSQIRCSYIYVAPGASPPDLPFYAAAGLERGVIAPDLLAAINIFDLPDSNLPQEAVKFWTEFKRRLLALHSVSDVFGAPVYDGASFDNMMQQWYFYYEARRILIESLFCGFRGFYSAASALLRIFLEFSLLQVYYYQTTSKCQNYRALEEYWRNGIHPSWSTIIQRGLPDDSFCRPLRFRCSTHLKALSRSAAHAYHPDSSPRQYAGQAPSPSFEGIFFWYEHNLILQCALWVYCAVFPMLLQPCDLLQKFGLSPPVGVLVDLSAGSLIRHALSESELEAFTSYSAMQEEVKSLLRWYDSLPVLTEEEIRKTGEEVNTSSGEAPLLHRYCESMAKMRALREALALRRPTDDEVTEEKLYMRVFDYESWRKLAKGK